MDRIVHLTSAHGPFDPRIFHKECRTLARAGFDVHLVAVHDRDQTVDGISIHAVPEPTGRLSRFTKTVRNVYKVARSLDAQLYHIHDPELIPAGLILRASGQKVIYDAHEILPWQIRSKPWIPKPVRGLVAGLARLGEVLAGYSFSAVVVVIPAQLTHFPGSRNVLVQNFPELDEFDNVATTPASDRPMAVAYVGGITEIRGIKEMVEAIGMLDSARDPHLVIAGQWDDDVDREQLQASTGWSRVRDVGWISRPEVVELLGNSRVGLAVLHPVLNYVRAQPTKVYEYMAAGIPVVASNFPAWREIIEKTGSGIVVDPCDPTAIAEAIENVFSNPDKADEMGRCGRQAVRETYGWVHEGERLVDLYRTLLG